MIAHPLRTGSTAATPGSDGLCVTRTSECHTHLSLGLGLGGVVAQRRANPGPPNRSVPKVPPNVTADTPQGHSRHTAAAENTETANAFGMAIMQVVDNITRHVEPIPWRRHADAAVPLRGMGWHLHRTLGAFVRTSQDSRSLLTCTPPRDRRSVPGEASWPAQRVGARESSRWRLRLVTLDPRPSSECPTAFRNATDPASQRSDSGPGAPRSHRGSERPDRSGNRACRAGADGGLGASGDALRCPVVG